MLGVGQNALKFSGKVEPITDGLKIWEFLVLEADIFVHYSA